MRGTISKKIPYDDVDSDAHTEVHGIRRIGRSLVQFVDQVNFMPKPIVFWHLADEPALESAGIAGKPSYPDEMPSNRPSGRSATAQSMSSTHTIGGPAANTTLQSHPHTRLHTPTGGEP